MASRRRLFRRLQARRPFFEVKRGEMRLPGESYERLYNLNDPMARLNFHVQPDLVANNAGVQEIIDYLMYQNFPKAESTTPYTTDQYERYTQNFSHAITLIDQMLEDKAIGRGDFYSPMDRYRILADVAPYSEKVAETRRLVGSYIESVSSSLLNMRVKCKTNWPSSTVK